MFFSFPMVFIFEKRKLIFAPIKIKGLQRQYNYNYNTSTNNKK